MQLSDNNTGADLLSMYFFPCCNCILHPCQEAKNVRWVMFLIQWGIDGRYSLRRVSSPPPPTFSTRLLESSKQRDWQGGTVGMFLAIKLLLQNTAGDHVTQTSMSLKITVACTRWRTPERNLNCRQNRKPPFIYNEVSTPWKDSLEKEVFGLFLTLTSGIRDIEEIYWPPEMSALAFLQAPAMQRNIKKERQTTSIK